MLEFYKGKRVFITGHTGFKGSWLCFVLAKAGAIVKGFSLEPNTNPSLFNIVDIQNKIESKIGDIRDYNLLKREFDLFKPEIVFHLAAQPLVIEGYKNPKYTYEVNVLGTINILECIRHSTYVKSFVNITTDKVYENEEIDTKSFKENDKLNGYDPYSNSKSCSEIITHSYKKSFLKQTSISTARAGNVIGGGDFSKDRIIPDCVKYINNNEDIILRNPYSTRPYQHVLESIYAYLLIGKMQFLNIKYEGWYNVGPSNNQICETHKMVELFIKYYKSSNKWKMIDDSIKTVHEAQFLRIDSSKIQNVLLWTPTWNIEKTIEKTAEWYKAYYSNKNIKQIMIKQIDEFEKDIKYGI